MDFYELSHLEFFLKFVDAFRFWLKSDKKKSKHFTWRTVYACDVLPCIFFSVALRPNADEGLLILEFLDHAQRHTTVGRTLLDEWSARLRDHYLTTHNTHKRQTFTPLAGFEPAISTGERSQTYALDRVAVGTGCHREWCL